MRGSTVGLAVLVAAVVITGCLDRASPQIAPEHAAEVIRKQAPEVFLEQGPGGLATRGEDSYWFVYVTGREEPYGSVVCDRGFSYDVNLTERSVTFNPEAHPIDPSNVSGLVASFVDRGSCPLAYGLDADDERTQWDLGVLGEVTIALTPDGEALVTLDGNQSRVPVGMQLRITGEGRVRQYGETWDAASDVFVTNHGAWPRSGLQDAERGPGW